MASATGSKLTREEYRRQKDLDAARKAGTAEPELDERGEPINPHVPQYIAQAPWYLQATGPSLKHQREQKEKARTPLDFLPAKPVFAAPAATKFRKGACENCGASTHKVKDCTERPRKIGAKHTGTDIKPDEFVVDEAVFKSRDFDSKRDRWVNYDPEVHKRVQEEWELIEEERKRKKAKEVDEKMLAGIKDGEVDEDKYAEAVDMPGQHVDTKARMTIRNLRIREDTAKYLYNLDPNSAYYDPKTRSMRESPFQDKRADEVRYAGDNFVRMTGEAIEMAKLQMFAWEAENRGQTTHAQAVPSQTELSYREYKKKKETVTEHKKDSIIAKYGGEEHLRELPPELKPVQNDVYVEYSASGKIIKGQERATVRSKYDEDVLINNHTSVWGSYWEEGKWGYRCCHSFIRNSYCVGLANSAK